MSDPSRWQMNPAPYSTSNNQYMSQQDHRQQPNYTTTVSNDNKNIAQNNSQSITPYPTTSSQQHLRALQPNPYPTLNFPYYPYPNNRNNDTMQPSSNKALDKLDNKRTRISRACDACRRKKIKCDTNGPGSTCKHCMTSNIECTFNDSAKKRGPPKGYIEVLETRLKRMEQILGTFSEEEQKSAKKRKINNDPPSTTTSSNEDENNSVSPISTITAPAAEAATVGTTAEKDDNDTQSLAVEISSISTELRTRFIGDMSPLPFLAKKIDFSDSRTTGKIGLKIRNFGQTLVLYEKDDTSGKNGNQRFLERLGKIKPGETIKGLNDWIYRVAGVDKATSDALMKIFFAYIHPGLPILNKTLFLKQYRGEIGEYPSAPLLNAIYGAAVRYIDTCKSFGDPARLLNDIEIKENASESFFRNIMIYMQGKYSPCMSTIQAVLIGQNHNSGIDEKMESSWLLNSTATRMAQDIGLHRSSDGWDLPTSEKETRKRVWWSVYIMDRWSSAATGRPQTIFDDDCDEEYPSESADWEEVMDVPSKDDKDEDNGPRFPSLDKFVAQKAKSENIPIYQPFVQMIKLSEILGKILQGLYTPLAKQHSEKHGSDAVVTYLDNALSEWRAALPPALQISSTNVRRLDNHGRTPLLSMSGLMYLCYCTLLILLHRPFIEKDGGQKTRSSHSSLSICTSAATRCVDIAEKMHYRDFLLVSWNFGIYPVFTASLIHIYNATNPDSIISDVAKSNLVKASVVIKRLSKISIGAAKLYDVLDQLTKIRDIKIDTPKIFEKLKAKHAQSSTKHPKVKIDPHTHETESKKLLSEAESNPQTHLNPHTREPSTELASPVAPISPDTDAVTSAQSTPSSIGNGDWINGLYSSIQPSNYNNQETNPQYQYQLAQVQQQLQQQQQQQQQQQFQHRQQLQQQHMPQQLHNRPVEAEPYTLRQFGLTMNQLYPPINEVYNNNQGVPSQPNYAPTNINTPTTSSSMQQPFNLPTDGFLFGLPDVGLFTPYNNMQLNMAYDNQSIPTTTTTTTTSNNITAPLPIQTQQLMDQSVFRNRPDNAFWSVPSTIELDDWTAYLLPQQPTTNSTATSSSWDSSQQRWA